MKPGDKIKPLKESLKDRQRKFADLLREKEAAAKAQAAREQQEREDQPRIGYRMSDGTIYAGMSPDTGKRMYAMPADASLTMTFDEAQEYAKTTNSRKACGYDDWRVPTKNELNVLFNNRAAVGGFDVSGSNPDGWYWSAMPVYKRYAYGQRFSDGDQIANYKVNHSSVRLVRSDTRRGRTASNQSSRASSSRASKSDLNEGAKP
jgi:hypothetical protein